MKKQTLFWGLVCILLCLLCFSLPVSADTQDTVPDTLSSAEIATTSAITITPADDFLKIGEQQQYTCLGTSSTVTWMIRDTNIASVSSTGLVTGKSQGQTYLSAYVDGSYITATIKVGDLEEGTYFLKNKGTSMYMELENASTIDGAPIEQQTFDGQRPSQWIIAMESTGVYSIRCAYTGKYIGVEDSSTEVHAAIKQYSSIANQKGRQWYIAITTSGAYRFTPRSALTLALAVPSSGSTVSGTNLSQILYTDNANYRDEWITEKKYILYTNHYYDQGYGVRFGSLDTSTNLLSGYQGTVSNRLMNIFKVEIVPNYITYTSSADTCKITAYGAVAFSNLAATCLHSPTHLTTTVLRNDLDNGTITQSVIIWTGHILTNNPASNSNSARYSIVITPRHTTDSDNGYINKTSEEIAQQSIFTLIHETSHQIGAHDHYCYGTTSSARCSNSYCDICVYGYSSARSCIMSYRYDISELTDSEMYCVDCLSTINLHLSDHH